MPCSSFSKQRSGLPGPWPRHGTMRLAPPVLMPDDVAPYMGMPSPEAGGPSMARSVRGALALVEPLLHPVAIWGLLDIVVIHEDAVLLAYPEGQSLAVECTGRLFRGASHVQLSLLTLGACIEELLAKLYDDEPLMAMACDAAASAALAKTGRMFVSRRRAALRDHSLEMSITYSPGCQALPLTAQRQIFSLIKPERIGVKLSQACLMHPAKSVTSVAPVGASLPMWMKEVTPCRLCNLHKTCRFRATHPSGGD